MEKHNLNYVSLYTFAYLSLGALLPLLGQHLKTIGFSGTQIGFVTAGGTSAAILAAVFWGNRYSKNRNKKMFLTKLCVTAAGVCAALFFIKGYFIFLLFFCLLYFFQSPAMAFIDAMAIEDGQPFGAARKWGAIGFACGVFFAGKIAESLGLSIIFFLHACGFLICAAILFKMSKKYQGGVSAAAHRKRFDPKDALFKNRKYIKIVACAFFMFGPNLANNVYFGFLFIEGGGTVAGIGFAFLLMAGSEAPFMGWSAKLSGRFTLEKVLLASMCISVARFAWYATCPSSSMLLIFFFLQGIVNGIMIVELVRYVAKVVNPEQLGMAISIYYAFGSNLSTILCQVTGGMVLDAWGPEGVYVFFAGMNAIGVAAYIAGKLYKMEE